MNASFSSSISEKRSIALWVSVFIALLAGVVAPRTLAFLPSILGVCFLATSVLIDKKFLKPKMEEIALFAVILLLAFLSCLWSFNPEFSFERSTKMISIFVPGIFFLAVTRLTPYKDFPFRHYTIALYLIMAGFLFSEQTLGHPIIEFMSGKEVADYKLNRSFVVFSLLSIPVFFLIKTMNIGKAKKISLFAIVLFATIISLCLTKSQTAQLCFLVGFAFLMFFPIKNKIMFKGLVGLVIIFCLAFPFSIKTLKNNISEDVLTEGLLREASIVHRFEVWNHTAEKTFLSPLYGHGIESLRFMKSDTWMEHQRADSVLHSHNAVLQIWVEFGIIGISLALLFLLYIFRSIYQTKDDEERRLYLAVFMGVLFCTFTGYGLWQSWHLGLFFAIAGVTLMIGQVYKKH